MKKQLEPGAFLVDNLAELLISSPQVFGKVDVFNLNETVEHPSKEKIVVTDDEVLSSLRPCTPHASEKAE